jgi:hypothetical protein
MAGVLAFSFVACDHSATSVAPGPRVALVSGNNQEVRDGSRFSEPMTVRVTRAGGLPAAAVEVSWRVELGSGEFHSFPEDQPVTVAVSVTDADGIARIYFFPTVLGQSVLTASAPTVTSSTATFLVNDRPRFEILFGPMFDCTPFTDPSRFSLDNSPDMQAVVNAPVSLGYYSGLDGTCTARVKTTSVPDGGESFDTGILHSGQTFVFTPHVAGTWEFTDLINGGTGLLIVR